MSLIPNVVPETQLQLEYNVAKIKADPYNYTLTDRVLFYDRPACCHAYNIFKKSSMTEVELSKKLGLKLVPYCFVDCSDIHLSEDGNLRMYSDFYSTVFGDFGHVGHLIKYNNLIINEESVIKDAMETVVLGSSAVSTAKEFIKRGYLKVLEFLFIKCISKSSLIPNLLYIPTNFSSCSLDELENIEFAKKAISAGIAPVFCTPVTDTLETDYLDKNIIIPCTFVPSFRFYHLFFKDKDFGNDVCKLGLCYAIIYGAEILYYFNKITDDEIKDALEDLFVMSYKSKGFCEKYLYSVNDSGRIEINKNIVDCFDDNNEIRFSKIKNYFDSICVNINADIISNYEEFRIPVFFAKFVQSMHNYAFQISRIKHAVLLYKEAKSRGVIDDKTFQECVSSAGSNGLFGGGVGGPEPLNELMNLNSIVDTSPEATTEEFLESEKNVPDVTESRAPTLNTMDALQKDLYDSMYSFDIEYVDNNNSNKEAYCNIANNISMITHNLAKQIKEIKTYNTGGKQSGLLTGKLDKKNLHRYKTDPKIFYNNNYKIKEMDLAFGCVLDESGSMSGEKIKNGRIVMIMLHEVLNSLGINHSIIGHSGNKMYQSTIYKYFQFKEESSYSLAKPYGLVTAKASSGNCDSGALYYMQKVMKRVQNKDKIVIIFSDGQPTECTDLDLVNQIKDMEKEGIHVIGVGINFDSIKDYYPDNANGKNLKEMVDIVISILKRYVLEKKED